MMSNATDILKELQDIGAVGDKIQEAVVRRPKPIQLIEVVSEPVSTVPTVLPDEIVTGLSQQIASLQKTLRGMLKWCEAAQETLRDAAESDDSDFDDVDEEPEAEEVVVEAVAEEKLEENAGGEAPSDPVPPPPPIEAVKPKLTLEEIRKHFLDPKFVPSKVNGNGAHAAAEPAESPEMKEKPNG